MCVVEGRGDRTGRGRQLQKDMGGGDSKNMGQGGGGLRCFYLFYNVFISFSHFPCLVFSTGRDCKGYYISYVRVCVGGVKNGAKDPITGKKSLKCCSPLVDL